MFAAAMGVVILLLVVVAFLLHAAARARARALADDVRGRIEPYLRRKAAEAGMPATAPTWTRRSLPEEIVAYSATLARRLLERERHGGAKPEDSLEFARTQPAESDGGLATSDLKARRE
jgi:hypothetical protein